MRWLLTFSDLKGESVAVAVVVVAAASGKLAGAAEVGLVAGQSLGESVVGLRTSSCLACPIAAPVAFETDSASPLVVPSDLVVVAAAADGECGAHNGDCSLPELKCRPSQVNRYCSSDNSDYHWRRRNRCRSSSTWSACSGTKFSLASVTRPARRPTWPDQANSGTERC